MPRSAPYDRDAALDAAMALFWQKGFHATSLKDLEVTLTMKPGSIYAAFTSKENLYLLALERYFEKSRKGFREQVARADTSLGAMANHFRAYAQMAPNDASRKACMLTKTLVDTRTTDPAIAATTRDYLSAMQTEFAAVFTAAQNAGEMAKDADPARLARRFQANITALRLAVHQGLEANDFTQLAEDMAAEIETLRVKTTV
ncbi:MAG: TetR family transcriptional regulator [Aliishimia sp.]